MDSLDEFISRRRSGLAADTAAILRELANGANLETVRRELHRIVGTCATFGLMEGSRGAADLLVRVSDDRVSDLAAELIALAEVFTRTTETEDR